MSIPFFLAISAQEFPFLSPPPRKVAWMSVHFSSSGPGLSNLPHGLPEGSLIILDDQMPWSGHSIEAVCRDLVGAMLENKARGLLLDFERPSNQDTALLTSALSQCCREIGVQLGAPESYAADPDTAIFLSPLPCQTPLERLYRSGRRLWLDVSPAAFLLHIGPQGATGQVTDQTSFPDGSHPVFTDPELRCLYRSRPNADGVDVLLYHTPQSIREMLEMVDTDAVSLALGLYREFK